MLTALCSFNLYDDSGWRSATDYPFVYIQKEGAILIDTLSLLIICNFKKTLISISTHYLSASTITSCSSAASIVTTTAAAAAVGASCRRLS